MKCENPLCRADLPLGAERICLKCLVKLANSLRTKKSGNRSAGIYNWSFADGSGNKITRGWPGTEDWAKAKAQQWANNLEDAVEYWPEGQASKAKVAHPMTQKKKCIYSVCDNLILIAPGGGQKALELWKATKACRECRAAVERCKISV